MGHSDPFHHVSGPSIYLCSERHDLLQCELAKTKFQCSPGCLGGIAAAPVVACETPADFHTGREMDLERRYREPDKPDEWGDPANLDGPEPETGPCEPVPNPSHQCFTFGTVQE